MNYGVFHLNERGTKRLVNNLSSSLAMKISNPREQYL